MILQANTINGNFASNILNIMVKDNNNYPNIIMQGNTFGSNYVPPSTGGKNSVLYLAGYDSSWSIHGNNFNNSLSQYEISTSGYSGSNPSSMVVNASNNFFTSTASSELIDNRLYDDNEDITKPEIFFHPYLTTNSTISCSSNCNNQGACVFPGFCVCEDGWSDADCSIPTCQSINFCTGNRQCSEFEKCSCNDGWLSASCSVANCTEVDYCNGNGYCGLPN